MDPLETTSIGATTTLVQNHPPSASENSLISQTSLQPPHHVTFSQPLAIKLEDKNFLLWRRQVLAAIKGHNLSHYINCAAKVPLCYASPKDALQDRVSEEFRLWKQ